jgi:hypothetical protein
MKRAPLDEEIRQELGTIAYAMSRAASLDERLTRWRTLFDQVGGHQGLRDTDFGDAEQLVGWGFALAMDAGPYREAAQLIEPLLRHPDFERQEAVERAYLVQRYAAGLLFADEVEAAVAAYRSALEVVQARPGHSRSATGRAWHDLNDYCRSKPESSSASSALAQLIYEVVSRRSEWVPRASARYEPKEAATYAELLGLLAVAESNSEG